MIWGAALPIQEVTADASAPRAPSRAGSSGTSHCRNISPRPSSAVTICGPTVVTQPRTAPATFAEGVHHDRHQRRQPR